MFQRLVLLVALALLVLLADLMSAGLAWPAEPQLMPQLIMEDQFGRRQDTAAYHEHVLVLLYGDQNSAQDKGRLGE